jgi:hypothetical protein
VWIANKCDHLSDHFSEEGKFSAVRRLEDLGLADFNEYKLWHDAEKKAWEGGRK